LRRLGTRKLHRFGARRDRAFDEGWATPRDDPGQEIAAATVTDCSASAHGRRAARMDRAAATFGARTMRFARSASRNWSAWRVGDAPGTHGRAGRRTSGVDNQKP